MPMNLPPHRLLSGLIAVALTTTASAGTYRDDRDPSLYTGLASQSQYDSVGQFLFQRHSEGGTWLGSGTLIGSNWVLTAGHVVDDASSMSFKIGGSSFTPTRWLAHEKWNGDLGSGYDIGLVEFDQDIATALGVNPAQRYNGSSEVGLVGTSVGFGFTGTGLTGATTYDGQKRAGQNMIDTVLNTRGKDNRVLLSDFDNPNNPGDSSWGASSPLDLEYMIAGGDSGGGLFINVDGIDMLAGVHSFGWGLIDGNPDSDYGDASGHTRVSAFNKWIENYLSPTDETDGGGGGGKKNNNGNGGGRPFTAGYTTVIPEPGSLALLGLGGLLVSRRRR